MPGLKDHLMCEAKGYIIYRERNIDIHKTLNSQQTC